jgi:hypothetical protein
MYSEAKRKTLTKFSLNLGMFDLLGFLFIDKEELSIVSICSKDLLKYLFLYEAEL